MVQITDRRARLLLMHAASEARQSLSSSGLHAWHNDSNHCSVAKVPSAAISDDFLYHDGRENTGCHGGVLGHK